ncbi:hypothetical protein H0H92_006540 [Tricholoma furcatifolium]|nr:hypothetical protein H0H92_006540 [Tricholoma furcatifolium]
MASLNKLAIRGIRSFDDKQISVIEFFSPVTVIVGHNGSGKTTIIECLKYATTGDQPPNTRGGAFIHDPKMANEKEVKAQVKLRFHAANGTRMLAVRNLSVTVKKTSGFTMKTLESILALADGNVESGGKRGVISTKCAEMDTEIPQLLGVSKAVLENVIFCHQEDSYWPLAEPAALKKKFDDIFEATRYTKALDNIKALRKDRVADLKAENERLQSLAREKSHSDKLKDRISQLHSTISQKQVEYEETKKEYEALVTANRKFNDYATKFREMYMKVESLTETKARLEIELNETKLHYQEIVGTDEELESRLRHFDEHINDQKQKRREKQMNMEELEEELVGSRNKHTELVAQRGKLAAEAEAQEQRVAEREQLIHEICEKHGIRGFNEVSLPREKIVEFLSRLNDTKNQKRAELEKLQEELRTQNEQYSRKQREMDNELDKRTIEKNSLRDQIAQRTESIKNDEGVLETLFSLPSQLNLLRSDVEEKKSRLTKHKADMGAAQHDAKLIEFSNKCKRLEEKRDVLNHEIQTLSLQSDVRAKLNLAKEDIRIKGAEIANMLELANVKINKLNPGKKATVESVEQEVNRLSAARDQKHEEMERLSNTASINVSKAETTINNAKAQLKAKKDELKTLERRLKNEVGAVSLEEAIKVASDEYGHRKQLDGNLSGGSAIYENLLRSAKQKKMCTACNRHINDEEFVVFEVYMKEMMKKASPKAIADNRNEMNEWESELERFQNLRPVEATCQQLKTKDIPALEKEIQELEDSYSGLSNEAEEAIVSLYAVKNELKDILALKEHAKTIIRLREEVKTAQKDVGDYEIDLQASGSVKTVDDVKRELDVVSSELRDIEREKSQLMSDRERQKEALRVIENSIHELEMKEKDLISEVKEKEKLESTISKMKQEITTFVARTKDLDATILEMRGPINALQEERRKANNDMETKITQAQDVAQDLNSSSDKLNVVNKGIERYVKDRRDRRLTDCEQEIGETDSEIKRLSEDIEAVRKSIAVFDKEINASGASLANYRDNQRVRKLAKDIIKTQAEIDSFDMEEAARAKRNFEEKYTKAKEKENQLQTDLSQSLKYSHIAGELSSHQAQLKSLESDLKEFKDINKKYTDQLIRVKASFRS